MRKKALSPEEIQEREIQLHFLRNFIEMSSDIFCNLDRNGYCLYINEGFQKITGHSQEEVIGTHFKNYIHPEDLDPTFSTFENRIAGKHTDNLLNRLITKTKEEIYVEWSGKNDENNESVFLVGRNVTEKILAEKKLIENRQRLKTIFENVPLSFMLLDTTGKILAFNERMEQELLFTTGKTMQENLNLRDFLLDNYSEGFETNFKSALNGERINVIRKIITHTHEEFWLNASYYPVLDDQSNVNAVTIMVEDITEKRKREEEIRKLEQYKETMVRLQNIQQKRTQKIRSLSLLQGQEEERKRLARELHDGIGQLLTAIKIKLNDIEGNLEGNKILKTKIEYVKNIVLKTIKETRNISTALVPIDLYDFGLDPSLKHLCDTAGQGSGTSIYYNSNLCNFRLNPTIEIELFRIIQEALNNSLKYAAASSIDVNVSFSEKKGVLKILIIDDGKGFDYDPDYIYKKNTQRSFGLRNMHERTLIINGKLNIISRKGQGCVITVEVPLKLNEL